MTKTKEIEKTKPAPPAKSSNGGEEKPPPRHIQVRRMIGKLEHAVSELLPQQIGLTAERLAKVTINCIESDPTGKLLQCTDGSLARAVLHAAEVGLEPGGAYGHCYLIPYRNKELSRRSGRDVFEADFQIGVWGYVHLARRSGAVVDVWADVIREKDVFRVLSGTAGRRIEHEPAWQLSAKDRGKILGAYACAKLADGTVSSELCNAEELELAASKNRGKNPAREDWPGELAKKTAIKRAQKYWPKGKDRTLDRAIEIEERPEVVPREVAVAVAGVEVNQAGGGALDHVVAQKRLEQAAGELHDAPKPEDEDQRPTEERILEALGNADERWRTFEEAKALELIASWTGVMKAQALTWALSADGPDDEQIPRPEWTEIPREPGEEG